MGETKRASYLFLRRTPAGRPYVRLWANGVDDASALSETCRTDGTEVIVILDEFAAAHGVEWTGGADG